MHSESKSLLSVDSTTTEATHEPILWAPGTGDTGPLVLDDEFQFELVYFRVENTLFTAIKQWFLVESSPFSDMFSLPVLASASSEENLSSADRCGAEGYSPRSPIILEQTKAEHFKAFLSILYPLGRKVKSYDEWIGVLHLSTRWNFNSVRRKAINALDKLIVSQPEKRIRLGEEYLVSAWLRGGLIGIVNKVIEENLDFDMLSSPPISLDLATIAKVFYICYQTKRSPRLASCQCKINRGVYRNNNSGNPVDCCTTCHLLVDQTPSAGSVEALVDQIFAARLETCLYIPHDTSTHPLSEAS